MTSIVQTVNLALMETGNRSTVSSVFPSDGSVAANVAATMFQPKMQALLRAAHWDFARKQIALTQLKAAVINGAVSADPPPQPWLFEYAYPSDCLKARFLIPTALTQPAGTPLTTATNLVPPYLNPPTRTPFVLGTDTDAQGNAVRVIFTNMPLAQLIYTADYSLMPELWDALFLTAATATLAAYFCQAMTQDMSQIKMQVEIAQGAISTARATNGNEQQPTADLSVDWMNVRMISGLPVVPYNSTNGYWLGWDSLELPGGLRF